MNINQIKKCCICKIKSKNWGEGTGFFCNIISNSQVKLKVLITNSHILEKNNIISGTIIELSLNNGNDNKNILIDESRKIFSHTGYDITIIEIKDSDGLNEDSFLDIYNEIELNINDIIKDKKDIYLLYYPLGIKEIKKSEGLIKAINKQNDNIEHFCDCDIGAGGGPLIYSYNNKVIGIHKGGEAGQKWKIGSLIEKPINEFMNKYKQYFKPKEIINPYNKSSYNYLGNNTFKNDYNHLVNKPFINHTNNLYSIPYDYNNNNYDNNYNNNFNNPEFLKKEDKERIKDYLQFINQLNPQISNNELNETNSENNNGNKNEAKENSLIIKFKYKGFTTDINANKNMTIENLLNRWGIKMAMEYDLDSCIFIFNNVILNHKSQETISNHFKNNNLIEVINYNYLLG